MKAEIKKLAALVARTAPTIAEGLEKLRGRVLVFRYQLSHIRSGKAHIQKSLAVWKPEPERYTALVRQIKGKGRERKALVAEKKELPVYHVKRHKAQAVRTAQEKTAEKQLEGAMHEKPSLVMLLSARQETCCLLGEDAEERQARQLIIHRNQEQHRNSHSKRKRNDPER